MAREEPKAVNDAQRKICTRIFGSTANRPTNKFSICLSPKVAQKWAIDGDLLGCRYTSPAMLMVVFS